MSANKQIKQLIEQAEAIASAEVERLARKIMLEHPNIRNFTMGMGGCCFFGDDGEPMDDKAYMLPLYDFISEWDSTLHITGEPMRIVGATGKIERDW